MRSGPHICLVGPGGAGKSSAGAAAATRLGLPFIDLDARFIVAEGCIHAVIARHGYDAYAAANVAIYAACVARAAGPAVIALSSGFMATGATSTRAMRPCGRRCWPTRRPSCCCRHWPWPPASPKLCAASSAGPSRARPNARSRSSATAFALYRDLPLPKLTTMRPVARIAADIARRVRPH
ncbi:shikimate kinase [Pseudorhodoferax sp.]|uniref:shikimate kinase n=1 Tax=Pseudorhodoferax sp. TaxID=1993553 RepID=UPI0039E33504